MKEIEKLIVLSKRAHDVAIVARCDEKFVEDIKQAITAAEAMIKRAVVIEDNHFIPESLEKVVSFCHVKPLNALEGKRVRIIVIPEASNAE